MKHTHWHFTLIGLAAVAGAFFFTFKDSMFQWYQATRYDIVQDLRTLDQIFRRIHTECVILSVDGQKNSINFLNVEKFTGSQVGPLNLAYPEKWAGPYLQNNLTAQAVEYQLVRDTHGTWYIVPGDGVKLSSGKKIGTDIILDDTVDIGSLIATDLTFNDMPLAIPLHVGKYQKRSTLQTSVEDLEVDT